MLADGSDSELATYRSHIANNVKLVDVYRISAFVPGHVLNYESKINDTMNILTKQLEMYGPLLDLLEWLRYFMIDTLSRIAFNEDLGFMI